MTHPHFQPPLLRFFTISLITLCYGLLAPFAHAGSADSDWFITEQGKSRILVAGVDHKTGELGMGIEFILEPGWKIYWRTPGDAGAATSLTVSGENAGKTDIRWPVPKRHIDRFSDSLTLQSFVYEDHVILPVDIALQDTTHPFSGTVKLSYAVCKDVCLFHSHDFGLNVPADYINPEAMEAIAVYRGKVPLPLSEEEMVQDMRLIQGDKGSTALELTIPGDRLSDIFVEGIEGTRFLTPVTAGKTPDGHTLYRIPVEGLQENVPLDSLPLTLTLIGSQRATEYTAIIPGAIIEGTSSQSADTTLLSSPSLALMLLYAFLGGLILNVMPCVLPVLSLKLLGIIKHGGGSYAQARKALLVSASGILVSFLILAGGAVILQSLGSSALGWGIQFQHPIFILALILVLFLFAFNLLGSYEIRLPGTLADKALALESRHRGTLTGHFFTGVLATLLATPCTAPFLGVAVSFALSQGAFQILLIFLIMGIGMAFPYLILSLAPSLVTRLPKPGPWMVGVKKFLAILLLATALWLLWVLSAQLGAWPAILVILLGLLLKFFLEQSRGIFAHPLPKAVAIIAASLLLIGLPLQLADREAKEQIAIDTLWQVFDEKAIPALVASGKVVIVDVTADWCITCKANKFFVLDRADVLGFLQRPNIVLMRADITNPRPEINAYIKTFNRYGIPFNAVYGPGAPEGIVLDPLLTRDNLYNAMEKAGGQSQ